MGNSSSTDRPQVPAKWDASQMPSQKGKVVIVTGANSGIGYETTLALARKGAHVVLACRNEARGKEAESNLRKTLASGTDVGSVEFMQLDVSNLSDVKKFVSTFKKSHEKLDLLINNVGVMGGTYATTVDGYERQFATNHLGHFALTAQLFDMVKRSAPSRIVNVSSDMHNRSPAFSEKEALPDETQYGQVRSYAQSKLCNLLFTFELDRRIQAAGVQGVMVAACHPGAAASNLMTMPSTGSSNLMMKMVFKLASWVPVQSLAMGALPTLYAATGGTVQSGDYYGPGGFASLSGYPVLTTSSKFSHSMTGASELWTFSEKLTNLSFRVEP